MKTTLLAILLFFCFTQMFYSQEEDGVVSLALPVRNSLTYNQFVVNPTFSFVRQQHKYIAITNKREWFQFDDAPVTYMASYSGRFRENIGIGVGVFQQNYGVLTTFGGIINFAYNAQLNRDNNLTFGINVGAYSSGINNGNVVINNPDPSLDNIPSNFLVSVNPGINYGTAFLDFGVSLNHAILYNFNTSELLKNNPEQAIQAHIMYTGYMYSNSFLDESKFTGRVESEFRSNQTVISGTVMLTVPMGIWAQVGYNTLYGMHGGLGLNITKQLSVEYNYEKATGNLANFGSSHELTLAYKFNNKERYDYSREDDVSSLITTNKKKNVAKTKNETAEANRKASQIAKAKKETQEIIDAEVKAKLASETKIKEEAEKEAQLVAESKAKAEADEQARLAAEAKAKADAEEQKRVAEKEKAQADIREKARLAAEAKAQADAVEEARLAAEAKKQAQITAKAKADAEEQARLAAEAKAQADAEEQARLAVEAKAQADDEEQERIAAEAKAQVDAEKQARLAAEAKVQTDVKEQEQLAEDKNQEENTIPNASDDLGKSMNALAKETEDSKKAQAELLTRLSEVVASKDKDLKDLKQENDLSEQGIFMEPKPFKSISAENKALEAIKSDLDIAIESRNDKIKELEALYEERKESNKQIGTVILDEVNLFYQKEINKLKAEQAAAMKAKANLEAQLESINVATDYERKRRIKRAAYNNEADRFAQDKATLNVLKQNTPLSSTPIDVSEFDFGEERSNNVQILKNVENVENGYYLILAVHNDVAKRDAFLTKAIASGRQDINFFYDVNTSKYYIYYEKADDIQTANEALKSKGNKPYNNKLSVLKIEN